MRTLLVVVLAGLAVASGAAAQDYGPLPGPYFTYFSKVNRNGVTSWRLKVEETLRTRGFSEDQIKKVTRLNVTVDKEVIAKGRIEFDFMSLPIIYHLETGKVLPTDPVAYANALPECLKLDERTCNFVYSSMSMDHSGREKPCLLPRRTVAFCKRVGFSNAMKSGAGRYQASCGEETRGNGCGADEAVFDDGSEQTKLAFSVEKALQAGDARPLATGSTAPVSAPATPAAPTPTASAPLSQPAFPKIVYRRKQASFLRREGPAQLEEWEYDPAAYMRLQKRASELYDLAEKRPKDAKIKAEQDAIAKQIEVMRLPAVNYCWPHDVAHPCDIE